MPHSDLPRIRTIDTAEVHVSSAEADGRFRSTGDSRGDIFIFSAFWDDREAAPLIRVLTIMELNYTAQIPNRQARNSSVSEFSNATLPSIPLFCHVMCRNASGEYHSQTLPQAELNFGPNGRYRGKVYGRYVISCRQSTCSGRRGNMRVAVRYKAPDGMTWGSQVDQFSNVMGWEGQLHQDNSLQVEFPPQVHKPEDVVEFGVCHPFLHGQPDIRTLMEWLEMLKILGVGRVVIYTDSLADGAVSVLRYYQYLGFVDARQTVPLKPTWMGDLDPEDYNLRIGVMLSDCMYRNMYRFRHLLPLTESELIVPISDQDLLDMFSRIQADNMEHSGPKVGSFFFSCHQFIIGTEPSSVMSMGNASSSVFLSHKRLPTLTRDGGKVAVDPLACVGLWESHCSGYTSQYDVMTVDVSSVVGTVSRYHADGVGCRLVSTNSFPLCVNSTYQYQSLVTDNHMSRYETKLLSATKSSMQAMEKPVTSREMVS